MNNELVWINLLKHGIDERFNVMEHLLQLQTIKVQEEITKNRIDEIEQHKNLLANHTKVITENRICRMYFIDTDKNKNLQTALETSHDLKHKTNELLKELDLKKKSILEIVKKININELSITELTEVINELRYQIYLLASEINDMFKSHYNDIKLRYQALENSTLEFMMSIK